MLPNPSARETRPLIPVHTALFLGFIITGMACTILGPTLPVFISRWNLTDAKAGFFFTTQFGGSLLGVITSGVLLSTRGYRAALILGFLLMAAGIAGLDSAIHLVALLATGSYGFGFGLAIPATNLCVAEISGERRATALNLLNIGWGLGAIMCPVIMLAGLRSNRFTQALFAISLGAAFLAVLFWMMKFENRNQSIASPAEAVSRQHQIHPIHIPVALALLFYLYVGTENGISGWAAEQARRIGIGASSTIIPMFFWAGLLSGRGISVVMLHRVREILVVISGLLLSAVGTVILLVADTRSRVILGVLLAGLGLSSVYPIFIAWLSKWYGERARSLGAVMFSLASIGGATVPWTVGFVSQRASSLRVGLVVPLVGCLTMIAVVAVLRRRIVA